MRAGHQSVPLYVHISDSSPRNTQYGTTAGCEHTRIEANGLGSGITQRRAVSALAARLGWAEGNNGGRNTAVACAGGVS